MTNAAAGGAAMLGFGKHLDQALGELVTEDRVSVSGRTGSVMHGRAAQVAADRVFFRGSKISSFSMTVTSFRSSGTLAYATGVGTHTVVTLATGQQRVDWFQYVEVLVRGEDGRWRSQYFMNAPPESRR
jgi:ketosteroid isomerase-like protein